MAKFRSYETFEEAQAAADEINASLPEHPKDAAALVAIINEKFEHCMSCLEYGCSGMMMECDLELLHPVYQEYNPKGWYLDRRRCLLRSWIEAEATGCDPMESGKGTDNEAKPERLAALLEQETRDFNRGSAKTYYVASQDSYGNQTRQIGFGTIKEAQAFIERLREKGFEENADCVLVVIDEDGCLQPRNYF